LLLINDLNFLWLSCGKNVLTISLKFRLLGFYSVLYEFLKSFFSNLSILLCFDLKFLHFYVILPLFLLISHFGTKFIFLTYTWTTRFLHWISSIFLMQNLTFHFNIPQLVLFCLKSLLVLFLNLPLRLYFRISTFYVFQKP
jgi:hypothetical protein